MKKSKLILILLLFFGFCLPVFVIGCGKPGVQSFHHVDKTPLFRAGGFEPKVELADEYILGPADEIELRVWGYDDLYQLITIPPNGTATFFPVGKIKVSGMTSTELEESYKEKLKVYVKEIPSVTVVVKEYNYYRLYVLGEVNKPGLYPYPGRLTVMQAISMAGTYTRRAQLHRINVVRVDRDEPSIARVATINLEDIMRKGDITQDVVLHPGDIVFVPSSFVSSVKDIIGEVAPVVSTVYFVKNLVTDE